MNNGQFINLFKRLNPNLKIVFQKGRPTYLPKGYRHIELKRGEMGLDYFDKGIFRFQETPLGFKKVVITPQIKGQIVEEVICGKNTLHRKFYDRYGQPKFSFCYKKISGCIREEIYDGYNELKERSIYRPNSKEEIDFPEIYFRGKLSHRRPAYLLGEYQILFGENCTRSTYDYDGALAQQEIHKEGKIVHIKPKQNYFSRLLNQPRAKISYAKNAAGDERKAMVECLEEAHKTLPTPEFIQIRHDNISFYRKKHPKQR